MALPHGKKKYSVIYLATLTLY